MTEQAKTREEYRKINDEKKKDEVLRPKRKRIKVRMFPIWLRCILLVVLTVVFMSAGAAVGYGMIGGGKTMDVFKLSTWTHISDLVDKR